MNNKGTGTLRLSREMLSSISSMRVAIKALYGRDLDVDGTLEMMLKAVAGSNPPLWEKFREMESRKVRMESDNIARGIMQTYGKRETVG